MKVLILTERGDRSRYWEAALPLLRKKGIDASFATLFGTGPIHEILAASGIEASSFDSCRARDYPGVVYRLAKFIKKNRFDVVHASEAIPAALAGFACLSAKNTKCVFHYHHTVVAGKQRMLSFLGSRLSSLVIAVSKSSQNAAVRFDGISPQKVHVAYNGIDPLRHVADEEIGRLRLEAGIPKNAKVVAIVARLRGIKGHSTLFEACRIAAAYMPDRLHLLVVGGGEEEKRLIDEARTIREFGVYFAGHRDDVAPWFAVADVVAMPSYFEPFGLVAVEAMSCGRALVASEVEGLAEIVDNGKTGILVPPKDANALADAILRVLEHSELARELGENARRRVQEKFTMEKMVEGWITGYDLALGRGK